MTPSNRYGVRGLGAECWTVVDSKHRETLPGTHKSKEEAQARADVKNEDDTRFQEWLARKSQRGVKNNGIGKAVKAAIFNG